MPGKNCGDYFDDLIVRMIDQRVGSEAAAG